VYSLGELLGVELVVDVSIAGASDSPGEEVVEGDDDGVVDNIDDEGGLISGASSSEGGGLSIEEVDESVDGVDESGGGTPGGNTNDETVGEVSVGVVKGVAGGSGVLLHVLLEVHGEVVGGGDERKGEEEPHDDPEDGEEAHETTDDGSATIDEVGGGVASVGSLVEGPEGGLNGSVNGLEANPATSKGTDDHHDDGTSSVEEGGEGVGPHLGLAVHANIHLSGAGEGNDERAESVVVVGNLEGVEDHGVVVPGPALVEDALLDEVSGLGAALSGSVLEVEVLELLHEVKEIGELASVSHLVSMLRFNYKELIRHIKGKRCASCLSFPTHYVDRRISHI